MNLKEAFDLIDHWLITDVINQEETEVLKGLAKLNLTEFELLSKDIELLKENLLDRQNWVDLRLANFSIKDNIFKNVSCVECSNNTLNSSQIIKHNYCKDIECFERKKNEWLSIIINYLREINVILNIDTETTHSKIQLPKEVNSILDKFNTDDFEIKGIYDGESIEPVIPSILELTTFNVDKLKTEVNILNEYLKNKYSKEFTKGYKLSLLLNINTLSILKDKFLLYKEY